MRIDNYEIVEKLSLGINFVRIVADKVVLKNFESLMLEG